MASEGHLSACSVSWQGTSSLSPCHGPGRCLGLMCPFRLCLITVLDSALCSIFSVCAGPAHCLDLDISVSGQILISSPVSLSQSWTVFLDSACFPFSNQVFRDLQGVITTVFLQCTGQIQKSSPVSCIWGLGFGFPACVLACRALACLWCPDQRTGLGQLEYQTVPSLRDVAHYGW